MTGPAVGKLKLKGAGVYLVSKDKRLMIEDPVVYIHIRGYALARVTHLDIEHDVLDNIIPPKRGKFLSIHRIKNGIEVVLDKTKEIAYRKEKIEVEKIEVLHPHLTQLLRKDGKTRTWVGGKFGGIYIGFRKEQIGKLESIARTRFNFQI